MLSQVFINMEIERYTLATGETAVTGFSRMSKPWGSTLFWRGQAARATLRRDDSWHRVLRLLRRPVAVQPGRHQPSSGADEMPAIRVNVRSSVPPDIRGVRL